MGPDVYDGRQMNRMSSPTRELVFFSMQPDAGMKKIRGALTSSPYHLHIVLNVSGFRYNV